MNMVYLLLYVIAAMIVGFVMVKTYQEKVCNSLAGPCNDMYCELFCEFHDR